ncbi:MAG: M20/M25/M40 family metallo-hydrolase [Candidatus Omnitrophica bacterium]|nr:M20/M25/M40 family metallo-hydrolase [Candidatus Omnitrophota bacterium]
MESATNISSIYQRPSELLQRLIRFDTTNPPGNEAECISFINGLLTKAGIETTILARIPERPNLIARLRGQGNISPLLLYGHVDVVTTVNQKLQNPPFEGKLIDDFVWGRGALDMKGGIAMMLASFLRAKAEGLNLPGDVVLVIVSDEETGGDFGSKYLVENHSDLFEGIRYAIGEFGGFTFYIGKRRFYPIMVGEKQICWMRATIRGPGGHGSIPVRGGAMARLSRLLQKLDKNRLPVHITRVASLFFKTVALSLGGLKGLIFAQLTNPLLTNRLLNLLGERGRLFDPLLHNTVSATILHGSEQINVIPSEISVEIDGRLLPGYHPDDMIAELHQLIGSDIELEVIRFDPGPVEPDMGLFDTLADILRKADPDGIPIPLLLSGVTDGRFFSRLGIQTYGFLPMPLPEDLNFSQTIHGANERIPVEALDFGASAIYELLQRYKG